ncbi:permease-like cell division protein FtsX [Thiohalobacter sp. IOR34]|uniref:permease-like cell division protein FtsX n=1 Tax=Thiohalobacter sp. IOR34 TaxID=3057176 RepID=UPI0025B01D79|nr:permease-like cell division protein FtsX [Thiohalobacter sp. IOR34]WJW75743.1 permease-like cell division protein FtsX [Thiohalobacter sp. IOR34]
MKQARRRPARRTPPPPRPGPGASRQHGPRLAALDPRGYLRLHAQTLLASLGRLYRTPLSSLMTAAVIGIALALPTGLLSLLDNLQRLGSGWDGGASISLFLKAEISDAGADALARRLAAWPQIAAVDSLHRADALAEFRRLSGFGEALDSLGENPLPAVLVIRPAPAHSGATAAAALVEQLRGLAETDLVQLDLQWVKRFQALMEIGRRGILVVGGLLGLAVLLIVGNTIRLDIQNRREEIEVCKLIGGTDAFIRRPFLYSGLWYGLIGGLLAWLLVQFAFGLLGGPVQRLAGLYQSDFLLQPPGIAGSLALLLGGSLLGWLGAWLAVGRHLQAIEPV